MYASSKWVPHNDYFSVVVTLSFNAKMVLANFWIPNLGWNSKLNSWSVGRVLKNNSQSTTHIDQKVGTGGKIRVLAKTCPRDQVTSGRAGKVSHMLAVCLTKAQVYDSNYFDVSTKTNDYEMNNHPDELLIAIGGQWWINMEVLTTWIFMEIHEHWWFYMV